MTYFHLVFIYMRIRVKRTILAFSCMSMQVHMHVQTSYKIQYIKMHLSKYHVYVFIYVPIYADYLTVVIFYNLGHF